MLYLLKNEKFCIHAEAYFTYNLPRLIWDNEVRNIEDTIGIMRHSFTDCGVNITADLIGTNNSEHSSCFDCLDCINYGLCHFSILSRVVCSVDEYNIQTISKIGNSKNEKNDIFFKNAVSSEISKFLFFAGF